METIPDVVSCWRNTFVHIPLREVTRERRFLDPDEVLWLSVLESTGQPPLCAKGGRHD